MAIRYATDEEAKRTNGTGRIATMSVTFDKLVRTFGVPNSIGDQYKVEAQWLLVDEREYIVFTIYEYKLGMKYDPDQFSKPVTDITEWHIGGRKEFMKKIIRIVGDALGNVVIKQDD